MKKIFLSLNAQAGIGLLQTIFFIFAASSVAFYSAEKQNSLEKSAIRYIFKQKEKSIEESLFHFFSDRSNCKQYFNSVTYDGANIDHSLDMSDIVNNLQTNDLIKSKRYDYSITSLEGTGDLSLSPSNMIQKTGAKFNVLLDGKGAFDDMETSTNKPISLSLIFEFSKDGGLWDFYSCYAQQKKPFAAKSSCALAGGTSNPLTQNCQYPSKDFNDVTNNVDTLYDFNLQDAVCNIELSINKQKQVDHVINNNGDGIKTQFCPAPKWNGCSPATGPNRAGFDSTSGVVSASQVNAKITEMLKDGMASKFTRILKHMDLSGEDSSSLVSDVGLDPLAGGGNSLLLAFSLGSSGMVGTALTGMTILGPAGALSTLTFGLLGRCSSARRLTQEYQCINGEKELQYIKIEKEKYRCKRFSCGCSWRTERYINSPSAGRIAKNIIENSLATNVDTPEEVGAGDPEFLPDLLNIQADITTKFAAIGDSLADFYTYLNEPANPDATDGGLQGLQDMLTESPDATGAEAAEISSKMSEISTEITDKEKAIWTALGASIAGIAVNLGIPSLDEWQDRCTAYQTYKLSVSYATLAETTIPTLALLTAKKAELRAFFEAEAINTQTILDGTDPLDIPATALAAANRDAAAANLATEAIVPDCN